MDQVNTLLQYNNRAERIAYLNSIQTRGMVHIRLWNCRQFVSSNMSNILSNYDKLLPNEWETMEF